jgi:type I restriction enzyme S subunit
MSALRKARIEETALYLGRGQSPSYVDFETNTHAINQKCIRDGKVDPSFARAHDSKVLIKRDAFLQPGDICINSTGTGTAGRIGLWLNSSEELYFADSHVTIFRPNPEIFDFKYLATLLQTHRVQTDLETFCFSGSTNQVELNRSAVLNLELQFLSLSEQQLIAQIFTLIDRVIEQTEALIAKQQRIKTGLMQDLLTKGIDEHGNIRSEATHEFKDSPLGRIPKEWEVISLSKCAYVIDPQPDHRTPPAVFDGIPYIGISDVKEHGGLDIASVRKVSVEAFRKQNKRFGVEDGDIIFGKIGTLGLPKLLPIGIDFALSANVLLVKPHQQPKFIYWILDSNITIQQVLFEVHITSQPAFGIEKMRELNIPYPPVEEQRMISDTLDCYDKGIKTEAQKLSKYKSLKAGLMQDLLTGKVSVESLLAGQDAGGT